MKYLTIILIFFSVSLQAQDMPQYKYVNGVRIALTEEEKAAMIADRRQIFLQDSIANVQDSLKYIDIQTFDFQQRSRFEKMLIRSIKAQRAQIVNLVARIEELENKVN